MQLRSSTTCYLLAALLLCAAPSRAQGAPTEARSLVTQGLAARREGRDAEALALFERAQQGEARASTAAQIGFALQALGRWVEAHDRLSSVLATDDPWVVRHRTTLEESLATVATHFCALEIEASPASATVLLEGAVVGALPLRSPLRVLAGRSALLLRAEGHYESERAVLCRGGERLRENVTLREREPEVLSVIAVPAVVTPPVIVRRRSTIARAPQRSVALRAASIATLATGGLALAASAVTLVLRQGAIDALVRRGCTVDNGVLCERPSEEIRADYDRAQSVSAASAGLVIAGSALVVGGAVLLAVDLARGAAERRRVRAAPAAIEVRF